MNKAGTYDFIIYTDGSSQNGSNGPGGYGVIIINTHSGKEYELSGGFQKATKYAIRLRKNMKDRKKVFLKRDEKAFFRSAGSS